MDEAARLRVVLEAVGARETARDVEKVDAGLKKASASAEVTRGATLKLAKSRADLRVQTVAVEKAEVAAAAAVKRYGVDSLQARDATARLAVAQQRAAVTADGLSSRFKGVSAHTGEGTKRLEYLGRAGEKSARQLKTGFVAAGVGAAIGIGSIVKTTVEFDRSMRNVNSIAGLGETAFQQLSKRVLDLAGPTAQAPKTLAEGLYDLVSSGFKAGESIDILHASAKAATAGLTDTATSTKAVAAVLNAYRLPASQAAKVSDYLFQTVNRGVLSFSELASTIGDVLPFASQLGVGMDQVGAALSTMTKEGINSFEATTRLKDVLQSFIKPSDAMGKAIKATGEQSGEALIKHRGLQGALEAVAKTTDGSKSAVAGLFPNIRALGGALALTGTNAKAAHGDLKAFGNVAGSTNRAFGEQSKSVAVQWQRATSNFKALEIELGTGLVPLLTHAAGAIAKFVQGMRDGSGAGGRFAGTLRRIWGDAKPVVNFFKDHPKLVAAAVAAWATYKAATIVALGAINVQKFRRAFGLGKASAFKRGFEDGAAYGEGFRAGEGTTGGGPPLPGKGGKLGNFAKRVLPFAARAAGATAAAGAVYYTLAASENKQFQDQLPDQLSRFATRDVRGGGGRIIQRGNNLGDLSRRLQAAMNRHDQAAMNQIAAEVEKIAKATPGPSGGRIAALAHQIQDMAGGASQDLAGVLRELKQLNLFKIDNKTLKILANAKDPQAKLSALEHLKLPRKVLKIIGDGGSAQQVLDRIQRYLARIRDKTITVTVRELRETQAASPARTEGMGHAPALPPRAPSTASREKAAEDRKAKEASDKAAAASAKDAAKKAAQARKDAADKARQAAADARQRAEDARQLRLSMIDARGAFRQAGTNDPMRQNRIEQQTTRQKLRLAATPLERLQDRTDLRGLRRDAQGLRVSGKQDDIQFALDMGKITNDVAANRLMTLAKMVHGNKALKRSLLTQAHSLRGQDDSGGGLELNVGDVRLPTVFGVRRDRLAHERAGESPTLVSSRPQHTTVQEHVHLHGDIVIKDARTPKETAEAVAAIFDKARRGPGAAAKRARG